MNPVKYLWRKLTSHNDSSLQTSTHGLPSATVGSTVQTPLIVSDRGFGSYKRKSERFGIVNPLSMEAISNRYGSCGPR